ncbi:MAG TPA: MFS transporter [Gemmatimonadaceae bacterium]|jgi:EmrB/QacA subfamily drug resistance transporter
MSKRWTLVATIIASSMTFIDGTVVNVALPALQRSFGATIADVQWVIEAYALFLGALLLVGGSLGDQLGRKRIFLIGVVAFTVASVCCGLAATPMMLIVARAVQGIGAALLVPGSLAIITATFDGEERGRAIGTWSGFSAITTAIGPVAGGWLVEHASWRAAFFINIPFALVVVVLSIRYVEETRDATRAGALDWLGATLTVLALGGMVFGLLQSQSLGWTHPLVAGSVAAGLVLFGLLVAVERRAANPMINLDLFGSRTFALANLLTLFLYGALGMMLFVVPLELIEVQGYTATLAGATLLPVPIILFALSRWSGGLVTRVGHRLPLTVGPATAALGIGLLGIAGGSGPHSLWAQWIPAMVVLGIGMAVTVAPLTTTVMNAVEGTHAGMASGINNAVSRVAGLLAIAVFGVVLSRSFESNVTPRLEQMRLPAAAQSALQPELRKMAAASVDSIAAIPADRRAAVHTTIDSSFSSAYRSVMLWLCVLSLAAAVVGAAMT